MAAFDFPSSPTTGQVFTQNGVSFVWNGYAWVGNAQQAGPLTEQFFNLSGATTFDVQVPAWATGVQLIGQVFATGAANPHCLQLSDDGTTFKAGATDYAFQGSVLNTGSAGNASSAQTDFVGLLLAAAGAGALTNFPYRFTSELSLVRPNTTANFTAKTYAHSFDAAATFGNRVAMFSSWMKSATSSALAIKAIRYSTTGTGPCLAGSWLRVKWLGDSAAVPMGNAIADAPQDNGEYVRVNGIWRLKAQTLVLDGLAQVDVDVPPGAKVLRAEGSVWWSAINANNAVTWRASTDGTTFQAGASDYFYGGFIHYAGSAGYANLVPSNEAFGRLSFPADTTTQPVRFRWLFPVVKSTNTNAIHAGTVNAGYYNTPTTNAYTDAQFTSGVQSGANLAIKKLRFFNAPVGSVFGNGSVIICDWVY